MHTILIQWNLSYHHLSTICRISQRESLTIDDKWRSGLAVNALLACTVVELEPAVCSQRDCLYKRGLLHVLVLAFAPDGVA